MWNTKDGKFDNELKQLGKWFYGPRHDILILHCNNARMVQNLHRMVYNDRPYERLTKNQRGKDAIKKKANLVYITGKDTDKFCKDHNKDLRVLTRGIKNDEGNYYKLFILMTTEKYDELIKNDT